MDLIWSLYYNLVEIWKLNCFYCWLMGLFLYMWLYFFIWNFRGVLSFCYFSIFFFFFRICKILCFFLKCIKCNIYYMYKCIIIRNYCCKKIVDFMVMCSKYNLCIVNIYLIYRICSWYVYNVWRINCKFYYICLKKYWWINKSVYMFFE